MADKVYKVWILDNETERPKQIEAPTPSFGYRTERACMMAYAFTLRGLAVGHREQAQKNIELARDAEKLSAKIRKKYK